MKRTIILILASVALLHAGAAPESGVEELKLGGYVGERLHGCIEHRVLAQPVDVLVDVFKKQDEVNGRWASEFWGKWIQGAVASYEYNHDPALLAKIEEGESKLIATQLPDGYIGDYDKDHQLHNWDVWGRKYTLLGLVKCYRLMHHKEALEAACKLLDYTIGQLGPGSDRPVYSCGIYRGMPPLSILEPVTFLYRETGKKEYLEFANLIAEQMNSPEGPMLLDKADVPVSQRFPLTEPNVSWGSYPNGQKGYEMMSCYIGMLEMYRLTADSKYLQAALSTWNHIVREEINIVGGACSSECWYGGRAKQTHPTLHAMETCVTFTWMQFNERLLQVTGDPKFVDQMERTMYNALFSSTKDDNTKIAMYTPLEGFRSDGVHQCNVPMNCCSANAPRAYAMIPRVAYRTPAEGRLDINFYIPSEAKVQLGKRTFDIAQQTDYPANGEVKITVSPDKAAEATIALRIPAWTAKAEVKVNGEPVENATPGSYCTIERKWQAGDEISLSLEMTGRMCRLNNFVAFERGPVVFARDSRFDDGDVDEVVNLPNNVVDMKPAQTKPGMWMAVSVPMVCGTYIDSNLGRKEVRFCDFASACNNWDAKVRYRVWLPRLYDPDTRSDSGVFIPYW